LSHFHIIKKHQGGDLNANLPVKNMVLYLLDGFLSFGKNCQTSLINYEIENKKNNLEKVVSIK